MSLTHAALPAYRGEQGEVYYRSREVPQDLFDIVARARAEKFGPWITPKMRVFEFGVGSGLNLAQLRCRSKVGYDVSCPLWALRRSHRMQFRWDTESIKTASFEAVICHHVLEHVRNPWDELREMRRLLVPEGLLMLNVPFEVERGNHWFDPKIGNGHMYSWTPQTLGVLLLNSGFIIESLKLQPFGYDRVAAVIAGRMGFKERAYRLLRSVMLTMRPRYEIAGVFRKR